MTEPATEAGRRLAARRFIDYGGEPADLTDAILAIEAEARATSPHAIIDHETGCPDCQRAIGYAQGRADALREAESPATDVTP